MVDSQEMRDAFSARLNEALDDKDSVRRERGRNVDFHAEIVRFGIDVKPQATHKWLRGEAKPGDAHMQMLADWLGVRIEWLDHGRGPKHESDTDDSIFGSEAPREGERPRYKDANYEKASPGHKKAVDDVAAQMLGMTEEQALKLKQAMELLSQANDPRKD